MVLVYCISSRSRHYILCGNEKLDSASIINAKDVPFYCL